MATKKKLRLPEDRPIQAGQLSGITNNLLDMPIYSKGNKRIVDDIERRGLPLPENPCVRDYLVSSVIMSTVKHGRIGDLLDLMAILGEVPPQGDNGTLEAAKLLLMDIQTVIG